MHWEISELIFLPKTPNLIPTCEKNPKLRNVLQNHWLELSKTVKIMKDKKCRRNFSRLKETKRHVNEMQHMILIQILDLGKFALKGTVGTAGYIQIGLLDNMTINCKIS